VYSALTYSKTAREKARSDREVPALPMDDNLVSKMRFKRRIENLEAGLQDPDSLIRQKAAEGLGIPGNYASVMPLIEALNDEVAEVRQEAVRALGTIQDPRSVDAIIQLILKDDSVAVIMSGAQALVNIEDQRGLEALAELLLRGVYDIAVQIASFPSLIKNKTVVNMLIQAMDHPNEIVRRQVAFVLGDIPNKTSVDVLIQSLSDADGEVKTNSASSLGRIGSKRALPELYQCRNSLDQTQAKWVVEEAIDSILEKGGSAVE
jgi:HEAT repeat protein